MISQVDMHAGDDFINENILYGGTGGVEFRVDGLTMGEN
jgi:hypothetical protein